MELTQHKDDNSGRLATLFRSLNLFTDTRFFLLSFSIYLSIYLSIYIYIISISIPPSLPLLSPSPLGYCATRLVQICSERNTFAYPLPPELPPSTGCACITFSSKEHRNLIVLAYQNAAEIGIPSEWRKIRLDVVEPSDLNFQNVGESLCWDHTLYGLLFFLTIVCICILLQPFYMLIYLFIYLSHLSLSLSFSPSLH